MSVSSLTLKRVRVTGLFGRYSHDFELDGDSRVTILHGPNGVGKTAILRLLFNFFAGRFMKVLEVRFSSLSLEFHEGRQLTLTRAGRSKSETEEVSLYVSDINKSHNIQKIAIPSRLLTGFSSAFSAIAPWLTKVDDDIWMDRRTDERLTTGQIFEKIGASESGFWSDHLGEHLRPLALIYAQLSEFSSAVDVHLIETQRLLSKVKRERSNRFFDSAESDSEVRSTVLECAEDIRKRVSANLSSYAVESQRLDQTLVPRVIGLPDHSYVDRAALRADLKAVSENRMRLAEVGLLIEKKASYGEIESQDLNRLDDIKARVVELYVEDTRKKLKTLDQLLNSISSYFTIVNSRFRDKKLILDHRHGLSAITHEGDALDLEALSSGEQHQLVLYFDLIFKANPGSLVLIDEPELSLHVAWQKNMLDVLIDIASQRGMTIVVATHSPYIVGSRIALLRELRSDRGDDTTQDW